MLRKIDQALLLGLGIVAGAGFGWPSGWIVIQLSMTIVFARISLIQDSPAQAAGAMSSFVGFMMLAGHWGAMTGVPSDVQAWTMALNTVAIGCHVALAWVTTFVACRLRLAPAARMLGVLPALWVLREWLSLSVDVSIPWLAIGYAHSPTGPLAALFPIGGVFLVGWASLIASAALALAWQQDRWTLRLAGTGAVAAACAAVLALGTIEWTEPSARASVELLQSGIRSAEKFDQANDARVLRSVARAIQSSDADLVVTSQLAIPKTIEALPEGYLARIDEGLRVRHADALVGIYIDSGAPDLYFNGVLSLGASGHHHYLKHDLFPFGEYLPLCPLNGWVRAMLDKPLADTARGPAAQEALFSGGLRLAMAICYESAFGDKLRWRAAAASAIVNLGSDSVFDSPQLARQFRQVDQARVLELQKPLIRSSDIRGSFVLDERARVAASMPEGSTGGLKSVIHGRSGLTPYARWGDALVLCVLLLALSITCVPAVLNKRRGCSPVSDHMLALRRLMRQRGQVLPVSIALMMIVSGLFYLMVNAGQTVTEKMRVTNAADAAAYSAAVLEARALNFDAYMNRGIVANQMAIAQAVSFASWIDYFAHAADHIAATAAEIEEFMLPDPRIIPLEAALGGSEFVAEYFGGQSVGDYAAYAIDGIGGFITALNFASVGLSTAQDAVQVNLTAGVRQGEVAQQVVRAMDPALDAEVVPVTHGFDTFTKSWSGDDRERLKQVAMNSRDQFTRERNWTIDGFDIPLVRSDPSIKKRGGTEIIGYDEWRGVDTLELHGQRFGCGKLGLSWCDDVREPIGWGGIEVDAGAGDAGHGYHGNAYGENPTTASRADSVMRQPGYAIYSGLPSVHEITDTDPKNDAVTGITIRVWKKQSDALTSGGAAQLKPAGQLQVFDDHPAAGDMVALSRAQVFFDRIAARADGKSELGSLYNPYWRVRLVAPTEADKGYAAGKQGGLALP